MVMTYKHSSSLPSGGTQHLQIQKSQAGWVKLQEQVNCLCLIVTKFFTKNSFWRIKLWINSSIYVGALRHLRTDVSTVHPDKWHPQGLLLHHNKAPAHTVLCIQHFFAWKHLLATQYVIATAHAPHTAEWVLNSFNTDNTMPKLKYDQQHSNTIWFKFPSSQAKKLLHPSYNLAANPTVLGDLHMHISIILIQRLNKKKNHQPIYHMCI